MDVIFGDKELDQLETDAKFTAGKSPAIVKAYRKRMMLIRSANDERDFYNLKSIHFEKLEGKRKHQHSMKLNDQYRLIIEIIKESSEGTKIRIIGIEDYH